MSENREITPGKCFAFDRTAKACRALQEPLCLTRGKCSRFKTFAEYHEQGEASRERAIKKGYYLNSNQYQPSERQAHDAKKA